MNAASGKGPAAGPAIILNVASALVMVFLAIMAILAAPGTTRPAHAAFVNVMVVSEDADPDTVERGTPIFNSVINALSGEMAEHIRIFDETAVPLPFTPPRTRRRDTELIETARMSDRPPIDILVIFQIRVTMMDTDLYMRRPTVHISGRILMVRGGRLLATFDSLTDLRPLLSRTCKPGSPCEYNEVGRQAATIARSLAKELTGKLSSLGAAAEPRNQDTREQDVRSRETEVPPPQ
jgi:hypothetical protein